MAGFPRWCQLAMLVTHGAGMKIAGPLHGDFDSSCLLQFAAQDVSQNTSSDAEVPSPAEDLARDEVGRMERLVEKEFGVMEKSLADIVEMKKMELGIPEKEHGAKQQDDGHPQTEDANMKQRAIELEKKDDGHPQTEDANMKQRAIELEKKDNGHPQTEDANTKQRAIELEKKDASASGERHLEVVGAAAATPAKVGCGPISEFAHGLNVTVVGTHISVDENDGCSMLANESDAQNYQATSYLTLNHPGVEYPSDFTIVVRFLRLGSSGCDVFVNTAYFRFGICSNKIYSIFPGYTTYGDTIVTADEWHVAVLRRSGATKEAFLDGVSLGTYSYARYPSLGTETTLLAAKDGTTPCHSIYGRVKYLRVYSSWLTDEEINMQGQQDAPLGGKQLFYDVGAAGTGTPADQTSVVGDPHVTNVAGTRFEIRKEGLHKLVQIPQSIQDNAKPELRVDAVIEHLESSDCDKSFLTSLTIFGRWTEDAFGLVHISQGSDMPNTTLLINTQEPGEFFKQFSLPGVKVGHAAVAFELHGVGFHVGKHYEGRHGKQRAYLNLRVMGLKGHKDVGGLLGYDSHSDAERPPANCAVEQPAPATGSSLLGTGRAAPTMRGGSVIEAE